MIVEDNLSRFDSLLHWAVKITLILGQSSMDTLILTSLLVLMGISTNQPRIYLFAGYLADWQWVGYEMGVLLRSG